MVQNCQIVEIHPEKIRKAQKNLEKHSPETLVKFFKLLSSETRIKILLALSDIELCVCDLSATLGMSISAISHQLRELKYGGVVKSRKVGKIAYYSLNLCHVKSILETTIEHLEEG